MRYLEETVQSGKLNAAPNNSTSLDASTTLSSPPPTSARYAEADLSMTSAIRRNLFGRVNNEENAFFLQHQLDSMKEEARARWNFDFDTETPENGRYEWTRVLVEQPRSLAVEEERAASGASAAAVTAATKLNRDPSSTFCHPHPQPLNIQQHKITICKPLLQTKITDHLVEKKRSHIFLDEPRDSSDEPEAHLNHVTSSSKRPKLKPSTNNNLEVNRSESKRRKQKPNST